ncbi:MAG TPA: glycosyltransferase [Mycobacteriales bacterium]|nr:glycosyltransferase [Mycobacteriales bacterium]
MRVVVVSLEVWDDVWRRNQHLVAQLLAQRLVDHVTWVNPPGRSSSSWSPLPHCDVVTPRRRLPKRAGGLITTGRAVRRVADAADVVWVNDPTLGVHALPSRMPAVYDVTDDWRTFDFPPRIVRRVVRAERRLATRAVTVVCSPELARRWAERYGVQATVVRNAIDEAAWRAVVPHELPGDSPSIGYVGTLHDARLDVDLVAELAEDGRFGTVHLVGPDSLSESSRRRLRAHRGVRLHGALAAAEVPGVLRGLDVLIAPHVISDFTLSLDAIKAYEYAISGRPAVATATSGFPDVAGITIATRDGFADAVASSIGYVPPPSAVPTWGERAREFAQVLAAACA